MQNFLILPIWRGHVLLPEDKWNNSSRVLLDNAKYLIPRACGFRGEDFSSSMQRTLVLCRIKNYRAIMYYMVKKNKAILSCKQKVD